MPLTKRSVSPVAVSLNRLPPNVRNNELECVANGTLANLVRQLSSLSRHAEDIFGELYRDAVKLEHKTNTLISRVDRLAMKVTQLDSNVEEARSALDNNDNCVKASAAPLKRLSIVAAGKKPPIPPKKFGCALSKSDTIKKEEQLSRSLSLRAGYLSSLDDLLLRGGTLPAKPSVSKRRSLGNDALPNSNSRPQYYRSAGLHTLKPIRENAHSNTEVVRDPDFFNRTWDGGIQFPGPKPPPPVHKVERKMSLQDLHLRKPFKSSDLIDQQSLARQTLPTAMSECYSRCDRPPELNKLNPFREDGVPGLKSYTDPEYFFRLWKEEMLKDGEHAKKTRHAPKTKAGNDPGPKKKEKRTKQPQDYRQKIIDTAVKAGNLPQEYQAPETLRQQAMGRYAPQPTPSGMIRPETLDGLSAANGHYSVDSMDSSGSHPRVSYQQQQQPNYSYQPPPQTYQQYSAEPSRPVTSQYMPAGHLVQQQPEDTTPTLSDGYGIPSPASSVGSSRNNLIRPNQPPPAPPPPPQWGQRNGDLAQRLNRVVNLGEAEENGRAPSPDLPPPPPPLSPQQLAHMSTSLVSTTTEKLPSPPTATKETSNGPSKIPPPPPPPPPVLMNGGKPPTNSNMKKATSPTAEAKPTRPDVRSDLLFAIRKGINLKKVDRQEEKQREKEAQEGHDVAAILRKRMEDVMGTSDSDDSRSEFAEEDDWDE